MYDVDLGICMYLLFVARGFFKLGTYLPTLFSNNKKWFKCEIIPAFSKILLI